MMTEQKLLKRAAMIIVLIALSGIGLLYLITMLADTRSPRLLDFNQDETAPNGEVATGDVLPDSKDGIIAHVEADRAFIRHVFPLISAWNLERVQPYFATQTLRQSRQNGSFNEVFAVLSDKLGRLEEFTEPGYVLPAVTPDMRQPANLAEYEFMAYYEKGNALVNLVVLQEGNKQSVYAVTINVLDDDSSPAYDNRLILAGAQPGIR